VAPGDYVLRAVLSIDGRPAGVARQTIRRAQ